MAGVASVVVAAVGPVVVAAAIERYHSFGIQFLHWQNKEKWEAHQKEQALSRSMGSGALGL